MADLIACETVTSPNCMASVREPGDGIRGLRCYRCGLGTCEDCSSIQPGKVMRGGRSVNGHVRMCDNCLAQEPDGEARVLLRRHHEAGYPDVTIEQVRAYIASAKAYDLRHPDGERVLSPTEKRAARRRRAAARPATEGHTHD